MCGRSMTILFAGGLKMKFGHGRDPGYVNLVSFFLAFRPLLEAVVCPFKSNRMPKVSLVRNE